MKRVIRDVVSECFMQLSDPRVSGFISIMEVNLTPDSRQADVIVRIFANTEVEKKNTFKAIQHARGHIQTVLAGELNIRFCPIISFSLDEKMEKTLDTLRLIDQVSAELAHSSGGEEVEESEEAAEEFEDVETIEDVEDFEEDDFDEDDEDWDSDEK